MYLIPVSVKKSTIEGMGVFAEADVPKGEVVWKYTVGHDKALSKSEYEELPLSEKEYMNKIAYLSSTSGHYIFPPANDPALYTNHDASKHNLTVVVDKSISPEPFFIANRDIETGEELTNNYHEFDASIGLDRVVPDWL
jgi:SET domain-containing protein